MKCDPHSLPFWYCLTSTMTCIIHFARDMHRPVFSSPLSIWFHHRSERSTIAFRICSFSDCYMLTQASGLVSKKFHYILKDSNLRGLFELQAFFKSSVKLTFDWCCFYYFLRNSLVALLEALFSRIINYASFGNSAPTKWFISAQTGGCSEYQDVPRLRMR